MKSSQRVIIPMESVLRKCTPTQFDFLDKMNIGIRGALQEAFRIAALTDVRLDHENFTRTLDRVDAINGWNRSQPEFKSRWSLEESLAVLDDILFIFYDNLYIYLMMTLQKIRVANTTPIIDFRDFKYLDDSVFVDVVYDYIPF